MAEHWIARRAKTAGSLAGSHFDCHQRAYQSSDFTICGGIGSNRHVAIQSMLLTGYVLSLLKSFH
jgi:hypothetical protein